MTVHRPGCPLRGMPWLAESDATARAALADRAARALAEETAAAPGPDVWAEVGLAAVLRQASPPEAAHRLAWCTCGHDGPI